MANKVAHDVLLAECEPYFLDGVHTIVHVAQRNQELVREAVERHLGPLVKALGFSSDEISLSDYWNPDKLQRTKPIDAICIGVKLKVSDLFEGYIDRYWIYEKDEKLTGVEIGTWIKGRPKLDRLNRAIDDVPNEPPAPAESWSFYKSKEYATYWFDRQLHESEVGELDLRLDEIIAYYISVIEKVGGVKMFLS